MSADSITSVLPVLGEFLPRLNPFKNWVEPSFDTTVPAPAEPETPPRLVPNNWVALGALISVVVGTVLVWALFGNKGISWWATVLGYGLGALLSLLGYAIHLFHIDPSDRFL